MRYEVCIGLLYKLVCTYGSQVRRTVRILEYTNKYDGRILTHSEVGATCSHFLSLHVTGLVLTYIIRKGSNNNIYISFERLIAGPKR